MIKEDHGLSRVEIGKERIAQSVAQHDAARLRVVGRVPGDPVGESAVFEFHVELGIDRDARGVAPDLPVVAALDARSGVLRRDRVLLRFRDFGKRDVDVDELLDAGNGEDVFAVVQFALARDALQRDTQRPEDVFAAGEVREIDGDPDGLVVKETLLRQIGEQRRVGVELPHPRGVDVLVVVEAVDDAVFVFVLEAVRELQHLEAAEPGEPEPLDVGLYGELLEVLRRGAVLGQFVGDPLGLDQSGEALHVARLFDVVLFDILRADVSDEFVEFAVQRFVVGDLDVVERLVREHGLRGIGETADQDRAGTFGHRGILRGAVHVPAGVGNEHVPVSLVREIVGDVLGEDVRARAVELPPSGVVEDQLRGSKHPSFVVEPPHRGLMAGVVHLVADAEDRDGGMVAVAEDCLSPVGVVEREILLVALAVVLVGKADLHVDEKPQLVGRPDEILRRHGAVEPHQIEPVFFRLRDVAAEALAVAFAREIGVVVRDDPADVPAEEKRFAVDEDRGVADGLEFA